MGGITGKVLILEPVSVMTHTFSMFLALFSTSPLESSCDCNRMEGMDINKLLVCCQTGTLILQSCFDHTTTRKINYQ